MVPQPQSSPLIAGSVLPIKRAEELLATLPGVIAARIIASETGAVDEIHVLTTAEVTPKQTVRNVESALIAHLGMRVDHRKISVATTLEPQAPRESAPMKEGPRVTGAASAGAPASREAPTASPAAAAMPAMDRRALYFEDVEVRRSRAKGIACRVTLRKGDESYSGDAEGMETERSRIELAARAALAAITNAGYADRFFVLDGIRQLEAFEREFVFVGVTARHGRASVLLSGSCEIKDSAETASVLAVLDATNRWIAHTK